MFVCGNAGLEALFTGDLDRAQVAFDEQLRLCREHVIDWPASESLAGVAAIATQQGDLKRAVRLLGAATANSPIGDADVTAQFEQASSHPRARYGERQWNDAHAAGARLSLEDAIAYALNHDATPAEAADGEDHAVH